MTKRNKVGADGETLAVNWCNQHGFTVLATNWRYKRLEADIIAGKENVLHIIEVKTRTNTQYGMPEESVSVKKIENMLKLGNIYKQTIPQYKTIQFDVLSILMLTHKDPEYFYIQDVYI
jgi:putative endonuclease